MAFVTVRVKGAEGYTRVPLGKDRCVVGRTSEADISVKHSSVSREHCAFVNRDGGWWIEDLGSSNGSWVNKEKLAEPRQLAEKDIVKAGSARLTFHAGDITQAEAAIEVPEAGADDDAGLDAAAPHPREAATCRTCGALYSTAHRNRGERMPCPKCGKEQTV
jgi:predicted component of type VI protein secretion system